MSLKLSESELQEVTALVKEGYDPTLRVKYLKWLDKITKKPYEGCPSCGRKIFQSLATLVLYS